MKLKIACKNPNHCSFKCLNCPYSLEFNEFKKLYNEINELCQKLEFVINV